MWEVGRYEGGEGGGGINEQWTIHVRPKEAAFSDRRYIKGSRFKSRNIEKGTGENSFCDHEELSSCTTTCLNGTLLATSLIAASIIEVQAACLAAMKQLGDMMLHETFPCELALLLSFQDD